MKPLNIYGYAIFFTTFLTLLLSISVASNLPTGIDPVLAQAEKQVKIIKVRKEGTGDFTTISDAIKSIPSGNTQRYIVLIGPGIYKEKIFVDRTKPFVTLYGNKIRMPTIIFDDYSGKIGPAGKIGLRDSSTVNIESDYFMGFGIIFVNSSPQPNGQVGGPAPALRIEGDKAAFYSCNFVGFQDTLYDDHGNHYFKECVIKGTVDFIFGHAKSIYEGCRLHSISKGASAISAQGRSDESQDSGFAFIYCNITGTGDIYLGRSWKSNARVVFAYSYMPELVNRQGWSGMGQTGSKDIPTGVLFGEYKCSGPGASTAARTKGRTLTYEEAKPYLEKNFINAATWLLRPPAIV